ncbi:TadE/TadG family type IV pilus assembly protein [Microbacterium soli]
MGIRTNERGAAAVEFALVVPLLVLLLLGIIEFGWTFNQQVSLSNAARESARYYAVHLDDGSGASEADIRAAATTAGESAAPTIDWSDSTFSISDDCSSTASDSTPSGSVTVTVRVATPNLTGMFSGILPEYLTGEGKTICGG